MLLIIAPYVFGKAKDAYKAGLGQRIADDFEVQSLVLDGILEHERNGTGSELNYNRVIFAAIDAHYSLLRQGYSKLAARGRAFGLIRRLYSGAYMDIGADAEAIERQNARLIEMPEELEGLSEWEMITAMASAAYGGMIAYGHFLKWVVLAALVYFGLKVLNEAKDLIHTAKA